MELTDGHCMFRTHLHSLDPRAIVGRNRRELVFYITSGLIDKPLVLIKVSEYDPSTATRHSISFTREDALAPLIAGMWNGALSANPRRYESVLRTYIYLKILGFLI